MSSYSLRAVSRAYFLQVLHRPSFFQLKSGISMESQNGSPGQIRYACLKPFSDGWEPPSMEELKVVIKKVEELNSISLSGSSLGSFLGVSGRTIRRWIGGEPIPYPAWIMLCNAADFPKFWIPSSWNIHQ
ncbi:hypothetical protein [Chromobacterium vaccinii]|uniref:hypothetical protein n=1 Tax=Chromobacterium vaccinii TaxID=1108595 RepID=UPI0034599762